MRWELGHDALNIHLTLLPFLNTTGELKTKPTQHSVKELLSLGVQPDILVCRTEHPMGKGMKEKIALFCNVDATAAVSYTHLDVYKRQGQLHHGHHHARWQQDPA